MKRGELSVKSFGTRQAAVSWLQPFGECAEIYNSLVRFDSNNYPLVTDH